MKKGYAEEVANRIIEQLEQGSAPWQKPWAPGELSLPFNPTTGKQYKGINTLWLSMQGREDPRWMTYNQAAEAGAQVKRGEKGTSIVYWKFQDRELVKDQQGKPVLNDKGEKQYFTVQLERPRSFHAVVFNAQQIDGLPPLERKAEQPEHERHERAESILAASGADIQHVAGDRAFYSLTTDRITLPELEQFHSADGYYATALHELGHWTGHPSRLDRDLAHPFGSEGYAKEELRAEIASLMLGERLGIGHDPGQHVAYVGGWIKALKEDPREIFRAASDAERITGYVMGLEQEQAREQKVAGHEDPATELRALWDSQGVPKEQQDALIAEIIEKARPGASVGPFIIPTNQESLTERTVSAGEDNQLPAGWAEQQPGGMATNPDPDKGGILDKNMVSGKWFYVANSDNVDSSEPVFSTRAEAFTGLQGALADEAVQAFQASEVVFERELIRVYGDDVGDERYRSRHQDPVLQKAKEDFVAAGQASYEASKAAREAQQVSSSLPPESSLPEETKVRHHAPETTMADRTYLAVPYREKEQAKAAAKEAGFTLSWDKGAKSWYAPKGADLSSMGQWKADAERVEKPSAPEPVEAQFAKALAGAGLKLDGLPIMDGQIHRVPVDGDRGGQTSGAYAGHLVGRTPGGFIQNYKSGEVINWKPEGVVPRLSDEQRAQLNAEAAQRQQQRETATLEKHTQTASAAAALWAEAPAATADNAYCKAKGITDPKGLRVVPDRVSADAAAKGIRIAKTVKEAKALRNADPEARVFKAGDLLVPGRDTEGRLWTLESVNPSFKSLMKGGRKHGLFTVAGTDPDGKALKDLLAGKHPLVLTEGFSTGDTVAGLAGHPVVVAFGNGNMDAVAGQLREIYPDRPMILAADNDHEATKKMGPNGKPLENAGLVQAGKVAAKHGAGIAAPPLKDGDKGSDWNDLREQRGEAEAKKLFDEQMAVARRDAQINADRLLTLARTRDMEARNDPTTSADDAHVAQEKSKAAELMTQATTQLSEVRAATADAKIGGRALSPAAAKAGIDHKNATMADEVKQERQEVQNAPHVNNTAVEEAKKAQAPSRGQRPRSRAKGMDAGL
ncbi:zincin-like metallopeptidase domain-containing protein [Shinella yambaruensis]|uniref:DUF1738 domain-containing protein n=1 Tax=Shinella yambaruensis TaxID=415996 RepID=A0ABQ5ZX52_9HYPH|nr:zincin-like metallopeptidase domain-containing protein [Shinella yambaruensis]MCJ8029987.1 zincin-like metallopeptidase domain-containing protein [Shinella yambaruensis]MCU7984215.1 zincin-like metallopeptidase domain-containing protein [Shinella yambaruensis]GLR55188.1 hypothetical protein GCM10007923_64100 [Shinella yambaruensis]